MATGRMNRSVYFDQQILLASTAILMISILLTFMFFYKSIRTQSAEYQKMENTLKFWQESTVDGWWEKKLGEKSNYISPELFESLGYKKIDLESPNFDWEAIAHPDDVKDARKGLDEYLKSHGKWPYEVEVRYKHCKGHWVTFISRGIKGYRNSCFAFKFPLLPGTFIRMAKQISHCSLPLWFTINKLSNILFK